MAAGSWRVAGLADDCSGAMEVGALMARYGLRAVVALDWEAASQARADGMVIDLNTRHHEPSVVYSEIAGIAEKLRDARVPVVFLKTDSTLRGPIDASLQAILDTWGRAVAYLPAYPAMGRTVQGGSLFVHGRPLNETAFARDGRNPVGNGHIGELLSVPVVEIADPAALPDRLAAGTVYLFDAATDQDLSRIEEELEAREAHALRAGPAGSLTPLLERLGRGKSPVKYARARGGLVVRGSAHPASRSQVEAAGLGSRFALSASEEDDAQLLEMLAKAAGVAGWTALEAPDELIPGDVAAEAVAARLAALVAGVCNRVELPALVIFGGDTVHAILCALGVRTVESRAEILPGIPSGLIRYHGKTLSLATKAGGFGEEQTLVRILTRMGE